MALRAGVAESDITPLAGVPLMGYGARVGTASRVHDRLRARALCLDARESGGAALLVVSADLCLIAPEQADRIRGQIAEQTDLGLAQMLIGCSHTHSGPDTGLAELSSGKPESAHVSQILAGLISAGVAAWQARQPAQLRWSCGEARIGRNRRIDPGPLDPRVAVLRVADPKDRPLAVLFHHGCHGTVLGHDNLEISADWPGAAARTIEEQTGVPALFLLGAHADVDPRTRGLMDLAIPGQSVGLGHEAAELLGREVAETTLAALESGGETCSGPIGSASERVSLPVHMGEGSVEDARADLESRKRALARLLELPLDEFPRLSRLSDVAAERVRNRGADQAREAIASARLYVRDKTAAFFIGGRREIDVEVQVLRIGEAVILGLPLEPTVEVGFDWGARASRHFGIGAVAGIANGWLRYLPHPADLAHPRSHQHYEVLMSLLAPGACERLLDVGERLAAGLS